MAITVRNLEKRYADGTHAVKGVDIDIEAGEFVTLLGPSGCGKTTTLRLIAGLEEPTSGRIEIGGRDVTAFDPGDRNVAMVFQSYALYPHMTVAENMSLNLTVRGMSKVEALQRSRETARLLGIEDLLGKRPAHLSGGQRQRVALGRAIVRSPAAFLMDEPLSNLDLKLREQMRTELKALHNRLKVTTVYVTHDQSEALILSDRIVVMSRGVIEQVADPIEIYERPANRFVAEFIGGPSINLFRAAATRGGVELGGHRIATDGFSGDRPVELGIRPENVGIGRPGAGGIQGTVEFVEPYGSAAYAFIDVPELRDALLTRAHVVAGIDPHWRAAPREPVSISLNPDRLTIFDPATGASIFHAAGAVGASDASGGVIGG